MNALRDDNRVVVGMGVSSVDSVTPLPIQMDGITGRVLMHIVFESLTPTAGDYPTHDDNNKPISYGTNATDSLSPLPLLVNSNGIFIDLG